VATVLVGLLAGGWLAWRQLYPHTALPGASSVIGVPSAMLAPPAGNAPITVSLVALLSRPGDFDGKPVRIVGFVHIEFESDAIYLHREDFEQNLVTNSLRLEVPLNPEFRALNDRYIIVEGTFQATPNSRLRAGSIVGISRYDPLPTHDDLRRPR
jgi:hypothetical protein